MMISPGLVFVFLNFDFLPVRWIKGQKSPKMKNKNYIRHVPYLKNSITYNHDFRYTCVK